MPFLCIESCTTLLPYDNVCCIIEGAKNNRAPSCTHVVHHAIEHNAVRCIDRLKAFAVSNFLITNWPEKRRV